MANKFKAICLDLDGTLLNDDNEISNRNIESLRKCINKGIKVFLVTGRPYPFSRYHANMISEEVQVIASNGGCYEKGDRLIKRCIPMNKLQEIIDLIATYNAHAFLKGKEFIYTHEPYDERFVYDHMQEKDNFPFTKSYNGLTWDKLKENACDIIKILVYDFNQENLKALRQQIECINEINVSSYNDISFDINAYQTTKGNAIIDVMSYYGIKKEEILSFGDGENDISMFNESGYTVAMANGKEMIRKMCDEVTFSNNEDGVAHIVKRLY